MKTIILILIVSVKVYSQSGLNFKSEFNTPNLFSSMSIDSGKTVKENNYDRMMNVIFYGSETVKTISNDNSGSYITRTSTDLNKRNILVKQYFKKNNTVVELEKTETLMSINEKF
ncbi:MAG: hypothetical protein Q8L81_04450 [Bacteroidota bacterium]|nr:hypothetical protein [Bacteroidota bacterium]